MRSGLAAQNLLKVLTSSEDDVGHSAWSCGGFMSFPLFARAVTRLVVGYGTTQRLGTPVLGYVTKTTFFIM